MWNTPVGVPGWERMYPSYMLFSAANQDWEHSAYWMQDSLHHPDVKYPFDTIVNEAIRLGKGQWTNRVFELPGGYGTEQRILGGYVYLAPVPVTDPVQRTERARVFASRSAYYYDRWDTLYERWRQRVRQLIDDTEAIAVPRLPQTESDDVVRDGVPSATSARILNAYETLQHNLFTVWQHHFELLTLGYAAYFHLYQAARACFPGITDRAIADLLNGHEGAMQETQSRIADLASRIDEDLLTRPYAEARPKLSREFIDQWDQDAAQWFNIAADGGLSHRSQSWRDHPELAWHAMRLTREQGRRPDHAHARTLADALCKSYSDMAPDDQAREEFQAAVRLARNVSAFVEGHSFYVENWFHLVFWRKMRELALTFTDTGYLDRPDDVFRFHRWEVGPALFEAVASWGSGAPSSLPIVIRRRAAQRARLLDRLASWTPPPTLGAPPTAGGDPAMRLLFGVGTHTQAPRSDVFIGHAASAGTVTGPVRLVHTEDDLRSACRGEILVARTASVAWSAVFGTIGGLVTEIGGVMAHSAIVAREYGIPAVVGVQRIASTLRTGQLVEVDGANGWVRIL